MRKLLFVIAVLYTLALAWGSLESIPKTVSVPDNFDKVLHATAYLGLALLWLCYLWSLLEDDLILSGRKMILTLVGIFFYGIIIEILQGTMTDYRTLDIWDVAANTLGSLLGLSLFLLFINKSERLKSIF